MHSLVPEQGPDQPKKFESLAVTVERVTNVPATKSFEQFVPQLIPEGELVTVPDPVPDLSTFRE